MQNANIWIFFCAKYLINKGVEEEMERLTVAFLTLGCKVNYYETEKMMEQFRECGFHIGEFSEKADIYIINTCTVTNIADRKSRQMIHRAKKKNPNSLVVAVGCYVESGGEDLLQDDAIDAAFSNKDKAVLADLVMERFRLERKEKTTEVEHLKTDRTRAYLKVQDGCNQFCSYCMIPYVRGNGVLKSTPKEEVLEQIRRLAEQKYKEVVITGIHLSSYGIDFSEEINFVKLEGRPLLELIREAAEIPGIERIRLGSLEPRIITESFLESLSEIPQFCPHFHLSLQSGCDTVLKRMNRHYTAGDYRERVDLIRQYFDHPAITTDVIVGFPGETEEEFQITRDFLKDIQMADIHVFPYSARSGTKAAAMEHQVLPEIKKKRTEILIGDTMEYRKAYSEYFLGKKEKVLFEDTTVESGKEYLTGHNERYVRIGVTSEYAEKCGIVPNSIHEIMVEKVFCGENG